jgi:hypothetical protein
MVSFRMMGARILPSLLSLLPQTPIYEEWASKVTLEFCPYLLPEFVFTGHEVCVGGEVELPERYAPYFGLIVGNPDLFPGFFHVDLESNVLPKLAQRRRGTGRRELRRPLAARRAARVGDAGKPRG